MESEEDVDSPGYLEGLVKSLVLRLLNSMRDDLRVSTLLTLLHEEMLSFRALSRRLRVNNKRLRSNLRSLLDEELIEEVQIRVADGRTYRAYRLSGDVRELLEELYGASASSGAANESSSRRRNNAPGG